MLPIKQILTTGIKMVGNGAVKYAPAICASVAAVGVVTTAVMAYKAAPKANEIVARKKQDIEDVQDTDKELRRKIRIEMAKELAPVMAPVVICGALSIAMIFCSLKINARRLSAISSAYAITSTAFKEYKAKTKEIVGESKEHKIRNAIVEDHMAGTNTETVKMITTGEGEYTFFDDASGRFFKSDIEKIRYKINQLNKRLLVEMWISQNEYYYEMGLPPVSGGDYMGWNLDSGLIEVDTNWREDEMNRPYCVLSYSLEPRFNFGDR